MEEILDKKVILQTDADKVENLKEQVTEFIESLNSFTTVCKRYKVPVADLDEVYEAIGNETLVESIRNDQLRNGLRPSELIRFMIYQRLNEIGNIK